MPVFQRARHEQVEREHCGMLRVPCQYLRIKDFSTGRDRTNVLAVAQANAYRSVRPAIARICNQPQDCPKSQQAWVLLSKNRDLRHVALYNVSDLIRINHW